MMLITFITTLFIFGTGSTEIENQYLRHTNSMLFKAVEQAAKAQTEQAVGMNKNELADSVASRADMTIEQARNTLQATEETIIEAVAEGEKVVIEGFGSFQRKDRKARQARNPTTGEMMNIPAMKVPEFTPGKVFKDAVSGKSSELEYAVTREQAVGMNKNELADSIASKADITVEQARNALKATVKTIIDAVSEGDQVVIGGFGTFESRVRKAREGRNPRTGAKMIIPETQVPMFKAGKTFKEAVSGGSSELSIGSADIESSRMSMSNNVIESTGIEWFVLAFALIGVFAVTIVGAKVIYKRACPSREFRKILDATEC